MLLTLNAGSSSVRLDLFPPGATQAQASRMLPHDADPKLSLSEFTVTTPHSVVHRIVHGGAHLTQTCEIDARVEQEITALAPLAPLHNPLALRWLAAARTLFGPQTKQLAVFDTAFFADLPPVAQSYALPQAVTVKHGIRRFGFHGLAHQAMWNFWCEQATPGIAQGRVISLQLGSGCSIAAIAEGRPLDTSMGFSPLEGLMMASRSGDVDPGVLLYLQRKGMSVAEMDTLLSQESGLLGLSASTSDMQTLLKSDSAQAKLALDLYCYRARKYIGAYLAVLGGVDAIIFGGGVGQHAAEIRARILQGLDWAGIGVDDSRNRATTQGSASIHTGPVAIWVCAVNEAAILAQHAQAWAKEYDANRPN